MPALFFIIFCFLAVFAIGYFFPGLAIIIGLAGLFFVFKSMKEDENKRKE